MLKYDRIAMLSMLTLLTVGLTGAFGQDGQITTVVTKPGVGTLTIVLNQPGMVALVTWPDALDPLGQGDVKPFANVTILKTFEVIGPNPSQRGAQVLHFVEQNQAGEDQPFTLKFSPDPKGSTKALFLWEPASKKWVEASKFQPTRSPGRSYALRSPVAGSGERVYNLTLWPLGDPHIGAN
jgi:hypothetical protein